MSPEEFRRHGHAVVDWIADYYSRVETFPVLARLKPGEIRAKLPRHPPQEGESFERVFADVERIILPGITTGSRHYAYFPSTSGPAILGDLLRRD
jgi:aromatic-L-amino-acid decarboxylase